MDSGVDQFMRESDAFSWYMESDPALRSTIVTVAWLERPPQWAILVDQLDRATRLVPIFRQHPIEPAGRLTPPRWTPDPDFDLSRHLRRVGVPPPHTPEAVLDFARLLTMASFDPAHPLWEFTLVEGLVDGGCALVMKLHHSLTDGVGGMQLLLHLFDTSPQPAPPGAAPALRCTTARRGRGLVTESVLHGGHRVLDALGHQAGAALPSAWRFGRHPVRGVHELAETARSVGRMVAPVSTTLSPVMQARSLGRRLAMLEVGLDDLKRSSSTAGGSVNDGFLAAVTAGLRRYHEAHGRPVAELRVTLPINLRTPDDPAAGNRLTLERFTVPIDILDAADRIRAVGQRCRTARRERSIPYSNAIAGVLNLLPPCAIGGMLKHVDFLASNVPGIGFPVYLAGARMTRCVPFSPTLGAAVNVTLLSYDGTCCIGVTVDTAAVPDIGVFMACLAQGFEEVLALGSSKDAPQQGAGADASSKTLGSVCTSSAGIL